MVTMPFGKFKGRHIQDIPTDYLEWLGTIDLREWLRRAVAEELSSRDGQDFEPEFFQSPPPLPPPELRKAMVEIVRSGYRTAAKKFHPDVGGSHEEMMALTEAAAWLETNVLQERLGQWN